MGAGETPGVRLLTRTDPARAEGEVRRRAARCRARPREARVPRRCLRGFGRAMSRPGPAAIDGR